MTIQKQDLQAITAQLLSGMLANPHIYTAVSDGEARGQQERILVSNAVMMAEALLEKVEQSEHAQGE
jgi:hypothetical protein